MSGRRSGGSDHPVSSSKAGSSLGRRRLLGLAGVGFLGASAGCGGADPRTSADVIAGPDGRPVFEPAELTVAAGESVSWYFDSPGHNVCDRPADADAAELPTGADPFASYGPEDSPLALVPAGETYSHRFEVPGGYVYVCVPHERAGMFGRVTVED